MANNKKSVKTKKKTTSKKKNKKSKKVLRKINLKVTFLIIVAFGILFIFSSYAWFSTNLNVKVKTFSMVVTKNSGLMVSLDAINYDTFVEISADTLVKDLKNTYPNNTSQWAKNGLIPVSSNGIESSNSSTFDIYATGGVRYRNKDKEKLNGYVNIVKTSETDTREYNSFIAFDLFLKNVTDSPVDDNIYLEEGTEVTMNENASEEMHGLLNSIRIGFLKIGSVPHNTDVTATQNIKCNNNCKSIIYEPNNTSHTNLSIERAEKVGVTLINGQYFPTYGCIKEVGPIFVRDTVSGSVNLNYDYFKLQETISDKDFENPLFSLPNGVTKLRVYLWVEGQDIDSLETDSEGANIEISINLVKDTQGYIEY